MSIPGWNCGLNDLHDFTVDGGAAVVQGGSKQVAHVRLLVEVVKEWFFCDVIQIHAYLFLIIIMSVVAYRRSVSVIIFHSVKIYF